MSDNNFEKNAFQRYVEIIEILYDNNNHGLTKEEIFSKTKIPNRTFERDKENLKKRFNVEIICKKNSSGLYNYKLAECVIQQLNCKAEIFIYLLNQETSLLSRNPTDKNKRDFIETILKIQLPKDENSFNDWILPEEPIKVEGLKWFEQILRATQLEKPLEITFKHPYLEDEIQTLLPLSLKQFQFRWYVIGINAEKKVIRCALNWINNIEDSNIKILSNK